jgi:hypothetical protein
MQFEQNTDYIDNCKKKSKKQKGKPQHTLQLATYPAGTISRKQPEKNIANGKADGRYNKQILIPNFFLPS